MWLNLLLNALGMGFCLAAVYNIFDTNLEDRVATVSQGFAASALLILVSVWNGGPQVFMGSAVVLAVAGVAVAGMLIKYCWDNWRAKIDNLLGS